jgi:chloride channel protein, CIC family
MELNMREKVIRSSFINLLIASCLTGALSALLASALKHVTEFYEERFFNSVRPYALILVFFPLIGLLLIHFLRKYAFRKKPNKGIKEIYLTIDDRRNELPGYKIPSHFVNGFLTVIFGGSTGVEVSTVVSAATIGAVTRQRVGIAKKYKTELICAGVAGGLAALFGSPLVGLLFAIEVISRKVTRTILISSLAAVIVAQGLLMLMHEEPLFGLNITHWDMHNIPYILVFSVIAGAVSVLFTRTVLITKQRFAAFSNDYVKIISGAIIIGLSIALLPYLFGDGYGAVSDMISRAQHESFTLPFILTLLAIVVTKPLISSITLGAGGDGGVFAPSIVIGALLGIMMALVCNHYLGTHLIVVNFVILGIAAVLSGAIHAPLTSASLACRLSGGFLFAVPILIASTVARFTAKKIYPYTVYTYKDQQQQKAA